MSAHDRNVLSLTRLGIPEIESPVFIELCKGTTLLIYDEAKN